MANRCEICGAVEQGQEFDAGQADETAAVCQDMLYVCPSCRNDRNPALEVMIDQ